VLLDLNVGLHDQLLALRFVGDAIGNVGGDHSKVGLLSVFLGFLECHTDVIRTQVTLAGESAGAISTSYHLVFDDPSEGLFRAAIMMSGTPTS
jgi:carboxylesterase type B